MSDCATCKGTINNDNGLRCAGVCGKIYHQSLKCAGLDKFSSSVLTTTNNLKFICDECILYIHNVDMVLQKMDCAVEKNSGYLKEYKNEFEKAIKRNENEIIQLLKAIENTYMERLNQIKNEQKMEIEKMSNIAEVFKNESEKLNITLNKQSEKLNDSLVNSIKKSDEVCKNLKSVANEKKTNIGQTASFASILKNNKNYVSEVPIMKKNLPLIVKPKQKQKIEKTKSDLNKKVDPKTLKIKNLEHRNNGMILIETDTKENREIIKNELEKKMKDGYDIKIPLEIKPRFEIVHMNNNFSEIDIIEKLKKQNGFLEMSEIKVIKLKRVNKYNKEMQNAIIEVDKESFPKILEAEKLSIGWERCKVFDAIDVKRCYKCKGYNHRSIECKNEEKCLKCHQNHKTSDCMEKEEINKCINCKIANEKYKLELDENHKTFNKECPVYQKKIGERKQKIGY